MNSGNSRAKSTTSGPRLPVFGQDMGLQRRIMSYVGLGCLAIILIFGYLVDRALTTSIELVLDERIQLVELMAREVNSNLHANAENLEALLSLSTSAVDETLRRLTDQKNGAAEEQRFFVAWIGPDGEILAGNHPVPDHAHEEHLRLLTDLIATGRSGAVEHRTPDPQKPDHVLVYAPLEPGAGGLILEQPADMALAVPLTLQRQLLASGLGVVMVGVFLAWATTRQVVRPIEDLTATAQRITGGDLDTPVSTSGRDETVRLAHAFEEMRRQLRDLLEELTTFNQHLEDRVATRTQELARAMQERRALLKRTIDAQEEERARISRELHDEVGQFITGMVFQIARIESECKDNPEAAERLRELKTLANRTVGEVRRMIMSLRPSVLDDMGLGAALSWYAENFLTPAEVHTDLDLRDLDRLPDHVQVAVFRVLQEAMTNVLRHASATRVRVRLWGNNGTLRGTVVDNGIGFARGGAEPRSVAMGLAGMRERIELLGGTLTVRSRPGRGTAVVFKVPLEGREIP